MSPIAHDVTDTYTLPPDFYRPQQSFNLFNQVVTNIHLSQTSAVIQPLQPKLIVTNSHLTHQLTCHKLQQSSNLFVQAVTNIHLSQTSAIIQPLCPSSHQHSPVTNFSNHPTSLSKQSPTFTCHKLQQSSNLFVQAVTNIHLSQTSAIIQPLCPSSHQHSPVTNFSNHPPLCPSSHQHSPVTNFACSHESIN